MSDQELTNEQIVETLERLTDVLAAMTTVMERTVANIDLLIEVVTKLAKRGRKEIPCPR